MKKVVYCLILLLTVAALCLIFFVPGPRLTDVLRSVKGGAHAEVKLRGDREVFVEYGEDYEDPGADAWFVNLDGSREPLELTPSTVDTKVLGTTEVNYNVVRDGETLASVSRFVTVWDTTPPEITLLDEPGDHDYLAVDNYDGDISAWLVRQDAGDRIVYTVRDSSGNEARAERMKAPALEFEGGDDIQLPADYRLAELGVSAHDMFGRDLTDRIRVEGQIIPWKPGNYELNYSVKDDFGRSSTATRHVEVVKVNLPETALQEKVIYLTFNGGPSRLTDDLLDMLAKYDVKVTFFVSYSNPDCADLIGRAYREGHSIGLYCYEQNTGVLYASEASYFKSFDKMEEIIREQTGEYTRLVRFVGGSSNTVSVDSNSNIMGALARDLTNMGYRYYDWNIQPENDACDYNAAFLTMRYDVERICGEGKEAPVVLLHDTGSWNILAAELMIQWGLENGYTFKGIDMTSPEVHHPSCY